MGQGFSEDGPSHCHNDGDPYGGYLASLPRSSSPISVPVPSEEDPVPEKGSDEAMERVSSLIDSHLHSWRGLLLCAERNELELLSFHKDRRGLAQLATLALPGEDGCVVRSYYGPDPIPIEWMEIRHIHDTLLLVCCADSAIRIVDFCPHPGSLVKYRYKVDRYSTRPVHASFYSNSSILATAEHCDRVFVSKIVDLGGKGNSMARHLTRQEMIDPDVIHPRGFHIRGGHTQRICCVVSDEVESGRRLWTGDYAGQVFLWDIQRGGVETCFREDNSYSGSSRLLFIVGQICILPGRSGDVCAVRRQGIISLWDARMKPKICQVEKPCSPLTGSSILFPRERKHVMIWLESNSVQILDDRKLEKEGLSQPVTEWTDSNWEFRTFGFSTEIDSKRFATYAAVADERASRTSQVLPRSHCCSVWRYDGAILHRRVADSYHPNFNYRPNLVYVPGESHAPPHWALISEKEDCVVSFLLEWMQCGRIPCFKVVIFVPRSVSIVQFQ